MIINDLPPRGRLADRSAIVTGGASGAGLDTAGLFSAGDDSACVRSAGRMFDSRSMNL